MIVKEILECALLFDGIKEVGNNEGFEKRFFKKYNMTFQELMVTVGWKRGQAWCAYLSELIWKLAYLQFDVSIVYQLEKLFSGSAVQTYMNFKDSKDFVCSNVPVKGAVVIWVLYKNGKVTNSGHAGIVISVTDTVIETIEGNTNKSGSREGDQVAKKTKIVDFSLKENGLNLLGFIHPKKV